MKCQWKKCRKNATHRVVVHYRNDFYLCDYHALIEYPKEHYKRSNVMMATVRIDRDKALNIMETKDETYSM